MGYPRALLGTAGGAFVALAVLLALQLEVHDAGAPVTLDLDVWAWAAALREGAPWTVSAARALNWLGGGWFGVVAFPALVVVGLLFARMPRGALCAAVAMAVSAGLVQLIKRAMLRPRPPGMLVTSDVGSYPSGHTANAATLAVLGVAIVATWGATRRVVRWVALAGAIWVVAMALTRLLLSVHWVTDVMGGAMLGVGAALVAVALIPPGGARNRPFDATSVHVTARSARGGMRGTGGYRRQA